MAKRKSLSGTHFNSLPLKRETVRGRLVVKTTPLRSDHFNSLPCERLSASASEVDFLCFNSLPCGRHSIASSELNLVSTHSLAGAGSGTRMRHSSFQLTPLRENHIQVVSTHSLAGEGADGKQILTI